MSDDEWTTLRSEQVFEWHNMKLVADKVRLPSGQEVDYTYIRHPGSIAIVPIVEGDNVIVTEQYRYPVKVRSLEIPAGYIDHKETPEVASQRELAEETGFQANTLIHLGSFHPSNSSSSERAHVFLAKDLYPVDSEREISEADLTTRTIPFKELLAAIKDGLVTDGFTIIAAFLASIHVVGELK